MLPAVYAVLIVILIFSSLTFKVKEAVDKVNSIIFS